MNLIHINGRNVTSIKIVFCDKLYTKLLTFIMYIIIKYLLKLTKKLQLFVFVFFHSIKFFLNT